MGADEIYEIVTEISDEFENTLTINEGQDEHSTWRDLEINNEDKQTFFRLNKNRAKRLIKELKGLFNL